jgi:hypothetical protein
VRTFYVREELRRSSDQTYRVEDLAQLSPTFVNEAKLALK